MANGNRGLSGFCMFKDINSLLIESTFNTIKNAESSLKQNFIEEYGDPAMWSTAQMIEYHELLIPLLKAQAELEKAQKILQK
jgi:hypothetical protein